MNRYALLIDNEDEDMSVVFRDLRVALDILSAARAGGNEEAHLAILCDGVITGQIDG